MRAVAVAIGCLALAGPAQPAGTAAGFPGGSQPLAGTLSAIYMTNPTSGWATTSDPARAIVRTTDGGREWRPAVRRAFSQQKLQCLNADGTLRRETDAFVATGPLRALTAISCDSSNDRSPQIVVWRTGDGGKSWQRMVLPGSGTMAPRLNMVFVSADVGWLWADYTYETHDGGAHWSKLYPQNDLVGVLGFATASRGYGISQGPESPYATFDFFPYVTSDGGRTWTHVSVPAPRGYRNAYVQPGTPGFTGAASVAVPVILFYLPTGPAAVCTTYRSANGGRSWRFTPPSKTVCGDYFFNALDGWGHDYGGGRVLYRTTDGGEHWTGLGKRSSPSSRYPISGYYFVTPTVGFTRRAQNENGFDTTTNAGRTWAHVTPKLVSR